MPFSLQSLSLLELLEFEEVVDGIVFPIVKVSTITESKSIERRMRTVISSAWKSVANTTLTSGLSVLRKGAYTQKRINVFLARFGIRLKDPLTKEQIKFLERRLDRIWRIAKRIGAREAKFKPDFSLVDQRAVRAINRHQVFWIGDFYNDKLSGRIRAVSEDVLIKQGFSQRQAGAELGKALRREFGIVPGGKSPFAKDIPARYAGNPDLYFRQVASTAAHQSRSFGKMTAFEEGGISRYRLVNPRDDRTGRICRQMDGQVFSVRTGANHRDKVLNAKDPKDVKRISPWLSGEELENMVGNKRKGSKAATEDLARAGAILPPFHGECRTEPVVID